MTQYTTAESETVATTGEPQPRGNPMLDVLRLRNFRLLWIGESISMLGDQFYMIALPWLVLQLTGDPLVMGTVLALSGIPRAVFMLLGGALTDRFSPRRIMLVSNVFRLILTTLLTGLVLTHMIQMWMLYAFALLFGLADAFFFPAVNAITPQLVEQDQLQSANALVQGTGQLSLFAGPVIAGLIIAALDGGKTQAAGVAPDMSGIGIAFGFDALTFVVSAVCLWLMRVAAQTKAADMEMSVLASIREGMVFVWNDVTLRIFFLLVAAINMLISGPFSVGVPVLADTRLPEGAAAFGILMSVYGGGSLVGILLAGMLPKPAPNRMGQVLLVIVSLLGIGLALLGITNSTPVGALISLGMGVSNGYVVILFMTWLQSRTQPSMQGRMMSLLMFASMGLIPISMAVSGALVKLNMTAMFVGGGLLMTAITLLTALHPAVRSMEGVVPLTPDPSPTRVEG